MFVIPQGQLKPLSHPSSLNPLSIGNGFREAKQTVMKSCLPLCRAGWFVLLQWPFTFACKFLSCFVWSTRGHNLCSLGSHCWLTAGGTGWYLEYSMWGCCPARLGCTGRTVPMFSAWNQSVDTTSSISSLHLNGFGHKNNAGERAC